MKTGKDKTGGLFSQGFAATSGVCCKGECEFLDPSASRYVSGSLISPELDLDLEIKMQVVTKLPMY